MVKTLYSEKPGGLWLSLIVILSFLLWTYSGYRASVLSFTYDESSTVLLFINRPYAQIMSEAPIATNHLLNTVFMKLCYSLFPASEFVFRLPNVLAHGIYLLFSFLLVKRITGKIVFASVLGFILLNFNPYVLDFFSLARGYGLALSFTLATVFFWLRYLKSTRAFDLLICLVFGGLSVLSNFSLLNLYASVVGLTFLGILFRLYKSGFHVKLVRDGILLFSISALLGLIVYAPLHQLIVSRELFFGGETGLWTDTVESLISGLIYKPSIILSTICSCMVIGFAIFSTFRIGIGSVKSLLCTMETIGFQLFCLLVTILIAIEVQHSLFGTRYLIERTALFLVPIFSLLVFVTLFYSSKGRFKKPVGVFLFCASLFVVGVTVRAYNVDYVRDWKHEKDLKKMMMDLQAEPPITQVTFGVSWPYSHSCSFYIWLYDLRWITLKENPSSVPWNNITDSTFYTLPLDMAFVKIRDIQKFSITPIRQKEYFGNTALVEFDLRQCHTYYVESFSNETELFSAIEYTPVFDDEWALLSNNTGPVNIKLDLLVEVETSVMSDEMVLVFVVEDNGEFHTYKTSDLTHKQTKGGQYQLTLFQNNVPTSSELNISSYVWNKGRTPYRIISGELTALRCVSREH